MLTIDDASKWHMKESAHYNGGKVFFAYLHRCIEQPRLAKVTEDFTDIRKAMVYELNKALEDKGAVEWKTGRCRLTELGRQAGRKA